MLCCLKAAQASHVEELSQMQQHLKDSDQQLTALQEEVAARPKPEELSR